MNATETYSFDNSIPTGATTQWSVGPTLQILSSTNNSVTVQKLNTSQTVDVITAVISNSCSGDVVLKKIFANRRLQNVSKHY